MNDSKRDSLDEALAGLPRDVQPQRDLWPQIRAQIEGVAGDADAGFSGGRFSSRWFQLAAGVLLVLASSLTTYLVTRESLQPAQVAREVVPAPTLSATPVSLTFGQEMLGAEYASAHAVLDRSFRERVASLPPATRARLERNLADLRQAASELSQTLILDGDGYSTEEVLE